MESFSKNRLFFSMISITSRSEFKSLGKIICWADEIEIFLLSTKDSNAIIFFLSIGNLSIGTEFEFRNDFIGPLTKLATNL